MAKFSMTKQKFINQWIRHFSPDLSKDLIEKHLKGQYIWHVFSRELIEFEGLFTGNDARREFNQTTKTDCICCDMYNGNGVTDKLSPRFNTAEKIDAELNEFYVVAKDYSWTYIKTHEGNSFGPYFLRKSK